MLTSFGWSRIVHSVSVSLRTLLLDRSNVESLWTRAIDCARVSSSLTELESFSLPLSMSFTPYSKYPPCTLTNPSVCCGGGRVLFLVSFPRFCFFLGGSDASRGWSYDSVTSDVCTSFWLVTSTTGRRAALRAAKALTARSAIRTSSFPGLGAETYLPLHRQNPFVARQAIYPPFLPKSWDHLSHCARFSRNLIVCQP